MTDAPNPSAAKTAGGVAGLVGHDDIKALRHAIEIEFYAGSDRLCGALKRILQHITHPQPSLSVGLDREAVARVIAPDPRWRLDDVTAEVERQRAKAPSTHVWETSVERASNYRFGLHEEARNIALSKADAILALAAPAEGWQPIETAPKDGTDFLAREDGGDLFRASYHEDGYLMSFCGQPVVHTPDPTHWMPLPAAPTGGRL